MDILDLIGYTLFLLYIVIGWGPVFCFILAKKSPPMEDQRKRRRRVD